MFEFIKNLFNEKDDNEELESLKQDFELFQEDTVEWFEHVDNWVSSVESEVSGNGDKLSEAREAIKKIDSIKEDISALKDKLSKIESQFEFTGAVEFNTLEDSRIIIMMKDPVHGDRVEVFRFRGCKNYLRFLLEELKGMHKNGMSIGFVDAPRIAENEIRDIFHRGLKEENEG